MFTSLFTSLKYSSRFYFATLLGLSFSTFFLSSLAFSKSADEARLESYLQGEAESRAFLTKLAAPTPVKPEANIKSSISKRQQENPPDWVKSTLIDWVNTNSGSFNPAGLELMRTKVKSLFTSLGFQAKEIEVGEVTDPKGNKFVRKILVFDMPDSQPDILFLGHLDTVFEPFHPFQKFSEEGDLWKGPGVTDMKGGLILAAHVLSELKNQNLLRRIRVIVNDDEEQGSKTSGPFLKKYAEQAQVGLFFEASPDADITSSHSGLLWYETTVFGVASHAGLAHADGVNACLDNSYKMIEMYRLLDYDRGLTINPGIVNTPDRAKANIVCDEIKTTYDIRFVQASDVQRTRELFKSVMAKNFAPNLKGATVAPTAVREIQYTLSMPPERTKEMVEIYKTAAAKIGLTVVAKHKGAVDAYGIIEAPLKLLSGVGVYGGGMHSDKEFMSPRLYMRKLSLNVAFLQELLK